MKEFIKRRTANILGLFLILIAVFFLISIITHSKSDPSLTRSVSSEDISNMGGKYGAVISDILLQSVGYSSYLLVIAFISWGIILFKKHKIPIFWLRATLLICSLPLASAVLAQINGGYIGTFIFNKFNSQTAQIILFFIALSIFIASLGISIKKVIKFFFTVSSPPKPKEKIELEKKPTPTKPKKKSKPKQPKQPSFISNTGKAFALPSTDFLRQIKVTKHTYNKEQLVQNATILEEVLADFGVKGKIMQVNPGPVVTLYELEPAPGTKSSKVIGLSDDIARSMSVLSTRIAVIPGRNVIGIELPNDIREMVYLREIVEHNEFEQTKAALPLALGKDISGKAVVVDLAKMPHLLVAGTTGSGKSVAINSMIISLLYNSSPDECKLIMIDPKMLELSVYEGIPHLLTPVVTEPAKAVFALRWTVSEMENRYRLMSSMGVRNINGYNERIKEAIVKGEKIKRKVQTDIDSNGKPVMETKEIELKTMPYIVVVVDEMADLMLVAGKDIEALIQRLAQMARAAGIHIIMATQRPSVDVITGIIKANFPTRISFQVTSKIDSRTILGEQGAEQLLGMGDMLYMAGGGRIGRVHGAFLDDREIEKVVDYLKTQGEPEYVQEVLEGDIESIGSGVAIGNGLTGGGDNDIYDQAVDIVTRDRKASTSYIQRKLRIGYNKAASLVDRMEEEGIISQANHAGKREVLTRNPEGF